MPSLGIHGQLFHDRGADYKPDLCLLVTMLRVKCLLAALTSSASCSDFLQHQQIDYQAGSTGASL
jgi:hypothetical protein